jgi:hypothetical protein
VAAAAGLAAMLAMLLVPHVPGGAADAALSVACFGIGWGLVVLAKVGRIRAALRVMRDAGVEGTLNV